MNSRRKPGRPPRKSDATDYIQVETVNPIPAAPVQKYTLAEAIVSIQNGEAKIFRNEKGDSVKVRQPHQKIAVFDRNNCFIGGCFSFAAFTAASWVKEQ